MTDLEIMQRAKMYLDKLANGVNPLNDAPVPEGELINNVRISRCLFFVSDVLRQVIDNGGVIGRTVRPSKAPFSISRPQLDAFQFSDRPIAVSEIAKRISDLVPEVEAGAMNKLKYSTLTAFLLEAGFLTEVETPDGKRVKRPTEMGGYVGISTEDRRTMDGRSYTVTVYNRAAQQFLLDNMEAILAMNTQGAQKDDNG